MAKIVTLGEIMLRLSPPGYQRFAQASDFEINYGGAEANVAASLAQFGNDAAFVSKVPANAIGDAAVATLRKLGVDCSYIVRVLSMTERILRSQRQLPMNLILMRS